MGLLPRRGEVETAPEGARVLDIEGDDADRAFDALSSETARRILAVVYDQPSTPPEVRDRVGTSLQNVHYHLKKLEGADLIEPAGVGYSEKGNEMTVFAPKSEAVVLFAGRPSDRSRLSRVLGRVLGLYVVLAVAVAAIGSLERLLSSGDGPEALSVASDAGEAASTGAAGAAGLDPLLVFFLGGLVAITLLTVYWLAVE
jgi:DNA-binding transcriptional ArsR family regulator